MSDYYSKHPGELDNSKLNTYYKHAVLRLKDPNLPAGERQYYENVVYSGNEFYAKQGQEQQLRNKLAAAVEKVYIEKANKATKGKEYILKAGQSAAKSIKEITYHYRHTSSWVNRFGLGTEESNQRTQNALNELWRFTGELCETDETDEWAIKNGIGCSVENFKASWQTQLKNLFIESNLTIPENTFMQTGGKNGIHTEHLGYILAEMQTLPKAHVGATW
jgi:phenylacetate-CoA oxygenase PaaI subunit